MEEQLDVPAEGNGSSDALTEKKSSELVAEALSKEPGAQELEEVNAAPISHLPCTDHSDTDLQGTMTTSALNVVWSYGVSHKVPVLNLSDGHREAVMFVCSHMAVMYDYDNHKQYSLQGHLNCITCSCLSVDKHWLVTGDKGPNAIINVWDTYTGVPIQTLFDPNPEGGFEAVALNYRGSYLATLSTACPQIVAVWNWTVNGDCPLCSLEVHPEYGQQTHLAFCEDDDRYLVSTGPTQVLFVFWEKEPKSIRYYGPNLAEQGLVKPVGRFTHSVYQTNSTHVLTTTTSGYLVVWENNTYFDELKENSKQMADKRARKVVHVCRSAINVVALYQEYVVVADVHGHVIFLDQELMAVQWLKYGLTAVTSMSFAFAPKDAADQELTLSSSKTNHSEMDYLEPNAFTCCNFVLATANGVVAAVTDDGRDFKVIQREQDSAVHALSTHPSQPLVAIGSHSNTLKVCNFETKEVQMSRKFHWAGSLLTCAYDPKGMYLVAGLTTGSLYVLDSLSLIEEQSFHEVKCPITLIVFSNDSNYMATADAGFATSVYKRTEEGHGKGPYRHVGRYRAHYKPICDMLFGLQGDFDKPRLFSLSLDRHLVEYDLESSKKNLVVSSFDRIEQTANPCCIAHYPHFAQEQFFITANDQFKLKLYNSASKMCRRTLLGPTFGSPLKKLLVVPRQGDSKHCYGAYVTEDKVGLIMLPADGNPHHSMALIAHPFGVSKLEASYDGRYLFTAGGTDRTVHMWEINTDALEAQARLGGEGLIPFYGLLEGGQEGQFFHDMEDYFYYSQIRRQGSDSTEGRMASTCIILSEIPYMVRALGFYPSEQEIDDLMNEVKFSRYVDTGKYVGEVDLGQFIKLYVNHRPAFGLPYDKVQWAFDLLGLPSPVGGTLPRGELLDLLQSKGEHMTEFELAECLSTVLGLRPEGGTSEGHPFVPDDRVSALIDQRMPLRVTAPAFNKDVLGLELNNAAAPSSAPGSDLV